MRHNQNGRRFRGRNNNGGGTQGGNGGGNHHQGGGSSHHQNGGNNGGNFRRVNRGTQTFDSNGPEVRIRGNAYQINEKYLALAKDAASAGDRILAESYLQHAEHYQRLINEIAEEMSRYQQQFPQAQQQHDDGQSSDGQQQDGQQSSGDEQAPADVQVTSSIAQPGAEQPSDEGLEDISFLRNPVRGSAPKADAVEGEEKPKRQPRQRQTEQV